MVPRLGCILNRTVGFIVAGIGACLYLSRLYTMNTSDFVAIGLTTFGIIATLSVLCYTKCAVIVEEERPPLLWCGEKFLHASILLLQAIVLNYAKHAALNFLATRSFIVNLVEIAMNVLLFASGGMAFFFIAFGFDCLNDMLWKRYLSRMPRK